MVLDLIDYLGIFGIVLGVINFVLIMRYIIVVPDELRRIADELSKKNER